MTTWITETLKEPAYSDLPKEVSTTHRSKKGGVRVFPERLKALLGASLRHSYLA